MVRELIKLDSLILIFKIKNNLTGTGVKLLFNCDIHEHNTRSVGQKRISHTAEIWFNELSESLKDI